MGAKVTIVDDLSTGSLDNLQPVQSDILFIREELGHVLRGRRLAMSDYDLLFHLSANSYIPPSTENPRFDFEANLHNTFMILEAIRCAPRSPRLVNASSAAIYGNPVRLPIRETDQTVPISPYGVSKLAAERYVSVFAEIYGLSANSVRLFSVFGPRQKKHVVYDFFRKLKDHPARLEVLGDGTQARDFAYVTDVVEGLILAATAAPGRGEAYNLASGTTSTIADLVDACCRLYGVKPKVVYTGHLRPGDADKWVVDMTKIRKIGFAPKVTLETGLVATKTWFDCLTS
jgi:UDP-glucose 4-epimerase